MAQITTGIRSVLARPLVYDTLQRIIGAQRIRQEFVAEFMRPIKGEKVLDIGCGTAELLKFLPRDLVYVGYDPSADYINRAQKRTYPSAEFHVGLYGPNQMKTHHAFDIVILYGVLHHMDDAQVDQVMSLARDSLTTNGRLLTIDPVICSQQNPIARKLIDMDRGQNVRLQENYVALANKAFSQVKGVVRHRAWVPYTHWIMECQK
jgi:SAM-dependent methyltransferase